MSKVKIGSLVQEEIRASIPFITEGGKTEYIVVKNATKEIREDLGNLIWKGIEDTKKKVSKNELLELLIDRLTNIELDERLDVILEKEISHELNMVMFYITEILSEITHEVLMNANTQLSITMTKKLKDGIDQKTDELARMKKVKAKDVK